MVTTKIVPFVFGAFTASPTMLPAIVTAFRAASDFKQQGYLMEPSYQTSARRLLKELVSQLATGRESEQLKSDHSLSFGYDCL